jgi:hypothetical protein
MKTLLSWGIKGDFDGFPIPYLEMPPELDRLDSRRVRPVFMVLVVQSLDGIFKKLQQDRLKAELRTDELPGRNL